MANQTLAEFTEKLFVTDADHTFIWDTAASISKRVSRNSWLNSGTLTSDAPVTISQTWSTTGTYTAVKVVANETAAANTLSNVLELWSGNAATLKLSIRKSGQIVGPSGTIAAPTYGFADTDWGTGFSGWYRLGTGVACSTAGGTVSAFSITHTNIRIGASIPFGWTSGTAENALDTILLRDAANTLALRNGAAAQTFNVYGTYTSGTSYERLTLSAPSAANAIIGTNKGSSGGTARGLDLQTDGVTRMTIAAAGGVTVTGVTTSSGGFSATGLGFSCLTTGFIYWASSTTMSAPSDGLLKITNTAGNDFNRIQLGGTTSAFPAIKRSSTTIQARLADDTAFAPIQGKLTTDTAYTATVVAATGYITIYDSIGTAYRVPCAL